MAQPTTLKAILSKNTREGVLYEKLPNQAVRCFACGHRCLIREGKEGICRVRFNTKGVLYVPSGYVGALQCDPIEKKPFFHAFPGRDALSFGMLGCDFHCAYCQNWITSQTLRDPDAIAPPESITPQQLVSLAKDHRAPVMASTYNEPLITSEWAVQVFQAAKEEGIVCAYVSNGNGTQEVLEYLRPWVTLYKVDLKSFDDQHYRTLGGVLRVVMETIVRLKEMGFWLEIVTLVIPGFNDSEEELKRMAKFLVSVSPEIPWHVTAFHKDYRMQDPEHTSSKLLQRSAEIGKEAGLQFVYAGNLPGKVGRFENTYCPHCQTLLIERTGYTILKDLLTPQEGHCPNCQKEIPGVWC